MSDHSSPKTPLTITAPPPVAIDTSVTPEANLPLLNIELKQCMTQHNLFVESKEVAKREKILNQIQQLADSVEPHLVSISNENGSNNNNTHTTVGAKIFTFGSFRLGVYTMTDDVDTLCVIPNYVDRDKFTVQFARVLSRAPLVTDIVAIPSAFVPIVKLKFADVPIDLAISKLDLPSVPATLEINNHEMFKNLDESQIRSINGPRVADEILRLVPNLSEYQDALRAIRLWAKCRGIYSNIMGFIGGVGWAILVAFIAKNFPKANSAELIFQFFRIYSRWDWPTPVELKPREFGKNASIVWDPSTKTTDRTHYMPVITPMYPAMCATHNVSETSLAIICTQFQQGYDTVCDIVNGTKLWSTLFTPLGFFHTYQYYLAITAYCEDKAKIHQFSSLIESQLRYLCCVLEKEPSIRVVHPHITIYRKDYLDLPSKDHIQLLKQRSPLAGPPVLSPPEEARLENGAIPCDVHTTTFYLGLDLDPSQCTPLGANGQLGMNIPTSPFLDRIVEDEVYDDHIMSARIKVYASNHLPNHLTNEAKLKSPNQGSIGKKTTNYIRIKRSLDIDEEDDYEPRAKSGKKP